MDFEMLPPEIRDQLQQQIEQRHMELESFRHDIQRLFEELNQDHLLTLRHLLNHISLSEKAIFPAYLEGIAAATLKYRFNVCASCGVNHEEELLKENASHPDVADDEPLPTQLSLWEDEQAALSMDKFNVEPIPDSDAVKCRNCGQVYVSLADRMVKPPGVENCPGCIHKAKWG